MRCPERRPSTTSGQSVFAVLRLLPRLRVKLFGGCLLLRVRKFALDGGKVRLRPLIGIGEWKNVAVAANAVSVGIQMELAIRVFDIKGFPGLLDVVERVQNKLQGRWPSLLWVVVVAGFRLWLTVRKRSGG